MPPTAPKDSHQSPVRARWMRELERQSAFKTQIILYGNVKDTTLFPLGWNESNSQAGWKLGSLREALFEFLVSRGVYHIVGAYNLIDGLIFSDTPPAIWPVPEGNQPPPVDKDKLTMGGIYEQLVGEAEKATNAAHNRSGRVPKPQNSEEPFDIALQQMRLCLLNRRLPCAFIVEYASQLVSTPTHMQMNERLSFLRLVKTGGETPTIPVKRDDKTHEVQNLLILVCDRLTDLPTWLYLNNPFAAGIELETPRAIERRHFFDLYLPPAIKNANGGEKGFEDLVDLTDGMSVRDMYGIRKVAREQKASDGETLKFKELVDRYRYGERESEWDSLSPERLAHAEEELSRRVLGQVPAVSAVADVLRRARLHLSGAQGSSRSKPRGILFFAGPTGVGKTELAKAMAELIFGTEDACARFDMSEYGQEGSDMRFLGAPPGYIGYEEGGQLTNRVKSNPFSVLLFDEIEKAHPQVLDKFLQVLEDGRMTDGRGDTVYFGESLIVFTSNVGIYHLDPNTGRPMSDPITGKPILHVDPTVDTEYPTVRAKITEGVGNYFKHFLGRPELLNRIGQNIVVFDFIRAPVMRQIVEKKVLPSIVTQVKERWKVDVEFEPRIVDQLIELGGNDVANGGRGIGNFAEAAILNPLARVLFVMIGQEGNRPSNLAGKRLRVSEILLPDENRPRYEVIWNAIEQ